MDEEVAKRTMEARLAQGLPPTVEDEKAIARIDAIVTRAEQRAAQASTEADESR